MTNLPRDDAFFAVSRGTNGESRMPDRHPASEQERANATRTQCESRLRQAQESARHAREMLRRAIREVDEAEVALGEAMRRQDQPGRSPTTARPGTA